MRKETDLRGDEGNPEQLELRIAELEGLVKAYDAMIAQGVVTMKPLKVPSKNENKW